MKVWILTALFSGTLYLAYYTLESSFLFMQERFFYNFTGLVKLRPIYRKILHENFYFLKLYSPKEKALFEKRVQLILNQKQIKGRKGIPRVTQEMRVMVAATIALITFGYPNVLLVHFRTILLYRDVYYSRINNRYHRGESRSNGLMILSWKHFLEGFEKPFDGKNLGIHEVAHALRIENRTSNYEYAFLKKDVITRYEHIAMIEMMKVRENRSDFFRRYAGANYHEFFACAVECFFEKPIAFRNYNKELYYALAELLNQDMAWRVEKFGRSLMNLHV